MKKFDFRNIRLRRIRIDELNDRLLLLNLYITQGLTLLIALIVLAVQGRLSLQLFDWASGWVVPVWGCGFAGLVIILDFFLSRWVPDEYSDDGGINRMLFRARPIWHIAVISVIVAICEELLFRGAIQHAWGAYWTSILFAAIHIRYLQHWILTGMVFATSYGLGWLYVHTGSLWTPILAHAVIDLVMGCIIRFGREDDDVHDEHESQ